MINFFSGDARFFWPENLKFLIHLPQSWDSSLNTGIGIPDSNTLWITSYLNFTSFFSILGLSWQTINFIFWILPTILLSFWGTYLLFEATFRNRKFALVSGIIYTTNTYFLALFGGGQQGVAFAYALIPLVILRSLYLLRKKNLHNSIFFGLVLSIQLLFDPRFFMMTLGSVTLLYILNRKFVIRDLIFLLLVPVGISTILHLYWILPLILFKSQILPQGFDSISGAKFFSFAFFENTISLLHPNWPENIFGKVYFMRPEFLLIPILAFSSLLFLRKEKKEERLIIIYFTVLAIISAFFAKGTNEPFGEIFIKFFANFPGGSLFRDSTKFYSLIAISYSILIPFSLLRLSEKLGRENSQKIIFVIFIIFWIFTLRLLLSPSVKNFRTIEAPSSYISLKNFIVDQNSFFRTLWIPQWQRFGYFSDVNPAVGRQEIFRDSSTSAMVASLTKPTSKELLSDFSVKYVIIPEDTSGEIFLDDRKYSEKDYRKTVDEVDKISWLKKSKTFGNIAVFETQSYRDRFWSPDENVKIAYKFINPTQYEVKVDNAKKGNQLVFSESFDPNWISVIDRKEIASIARNTSIDKKQNVQINSFILPKNGSYYIKVYYKPQMWVNIGLVASITTLVVLICVLFKTKNK